MKNVAGMEINPVRTASSGPIEDGITSTSQALMASTMPVPESTPVSTAAASTMETTAITDEAWEEIIFAWSEIFGKFTSRATAVPTMNR